jgi:hypothetical protein
MAGLVQRLLLAVRILVQAAAEGRKPLVLVRQVAKASLLFVTLQVEGLPHIMERLPN